LAVPLVAAGVLAAGCGSSSSSSTTSTTSAAVPGTTSTGGGSTGQLKTFSGSIQKAKNATFEAVYTSASSSGGTQTITLAQSPPKQLFSTTDSSGSVSSLVNTGTATYSCDSGSGSTPTCTSMASVGAAGALSAVIGVYDGTTALSVINGWESIEAAHLVGVSLTFTNTSIAGQPVRCANWTYHGSSATYCVTASGVLARVESSGGSNSSSSSSSFELTSFTTSPPASAFELPTGATVVTIPSGA
jgi:hypothetical protein